jgi:hypothetical protein
MSETHAALIVLDAEERAGRKKGGNRGNQHTGGKVLGHGTLPREQVKAESRRAPLLDLPERDVDRYGEAEKGGLKRARRALFTRRRRPATG